MNYMSKIKIILNGEDYLIKENSSINDLISELNLDISKIAIERNLEIVLAEDFKEIEINLGDKIEIVSFIGGG